MSEPWPSEIRLHKDKASLTVAFDDESFTYTAEFLRVLSPSAEVQGHSPEQRITVPGKRSVKISGVEPVGNYAVRIKFNDGHSTGLYSWRYLHELGTDQEAFWQTYLNELAAEGLSRD